MNSVPVEFTGSVMTSYGGAGLFRRFVDRLGLSKRLGEVEGLPSGRRYSTGQYLLTLVLALMLGRGRQTEVAALGEDAGALAALGLTGVPSQSSLSRFLAGCNWSGCQALSRLNNQLVRRMRKGYRSATLDLDGHVISTRGNPQGANFGYNPKRKGARSYFLLLGFLAEGRDIVSGLLLPGSHASVSAKEAKRIYRESRRALPGSVKRLRLRADAAFYSDEFFNRLERDRVTYFVAVPGSAPMRPIVWGLRYRRLDTRWAVAEFSHKPGTWGKARRFVVIRERLDAAASGRQQRLFETERYGYQIFATNSDWSPERVWRFYNQRARAENIIKEADEDFALDHVVSRSLAGNRMWMLLSLLAYNLTNWFREKVLNQHAHRTMASGLRKTLIELPARLVYHARKWRLKVWRDHPSRAAYERAERRLATLRL
jgi:hypothetical protein